MKAKKRRKRIKSGCKYKTVDRTFQEAIRKSKGRRSKRRRKNQEDREQKGGSKGYEIEEEGLGRKIPGREEELALDKVKYGNASGEDGVRIEFLKALPKVWIEEAAAILTDLLAKGDE